MDQTGGTQTQVYVILKLRDVELLTGGGEAEVKDEV